MDGADFLLNLTVTGAIMSTVVSSLICLVLWNQLETGQAFLSDGDSTCVLETSTWCLKTAWTP